MPEATAIKPAAIKPEQPKPSNENWVSYTEEGLANFQKSVRQKLANAGIKHDTVPIGQEELPIHVPKDGSTFTEEIKEGALDVPETFNTKPDNLRHLLDFTGEGAPPRTGDARRVKNTIEERNKAAMKAKNRPRRKGFFTRARNWFYEDKKAA